jgi:catechol 2,3-dioxygenase-like lactoylglutathione lyase family enzyme
MLRRIDRIILRVPNLESAVRYYRDVLGLEVIRQDAAIAGLRMRDGESELILHNDPDLPDEAIYYLVDDVRDLYQRREALGLKFSGAPTAVSKGYRATVRDPFGTVLLLIDRSGGAQGLDVLEDAKAPGALFAGVEHRAPVRRDLLVRLYEAIGRTADDLPYTPHFESLYRDYIAGQPEPKPTRQETWRHLLNLRKKRGGLPKLGEARSMPPQVSAEARRVLLGLLGKEIGKRDRLPYTARFDEIVDEFNRTQSRPLSPHLVWRLVAMLAK